MEKDDNLITAASLTPEPDEGCVSTCYYVGWDWDHDHGGGTVQPEQPTVEPTAN